MMMLIIILVIIIISLLSSDVGSSLGFDFDCLRGGMEPWAGGRAGSRASRAVRYGLTEVLNVF